jgi:hypothetical protein
MILRAIVTWFGMLVLASLNGAARGLWIIPRLGEIRGRAVSTVILCGLVFVLTWLTIGWIRPTSSGQALKVGVIWLCLTLAFEFLAGHYVFGTPWSVLLAEYDVSRGRIWIAVLLLTLLAPWWTAVIRGYLR